jgi:acyl-homoserine-lactone acylase
LSIKSLFAAAILSLGLLVANPSPAAPAKAGPGPHGEILWDRYGVPHIYGKDEAGAFYGFGWATAQNHGDIVIHLYGEARGRAAEYWGGAANEAQDNGY